MKEGWTYVPFEEVCASMTKGPFGSDIKKSLYVPRSADTYKVYIQANAIDKDESIGDYYISKEYFDSKMSRFEVKPDDYIITCDGTLGRYLRLPQTMERGIISASLLRITLRTNIVPRFFEYLWDGYIMGRLTSDIRNSALVHLPSATKIGKVVIPLPSIAEQESIATELDLLSDILVKLEAQLKELDTLAQCVFFKMFGNTVSNEKGWPKQFIGDVYDITDYVANGSFATLRENVTYKSTEDYAILVRLADYSNGFDKSKFVYVDKHSYEFLTKSRLFGGEIIMSNVGSCGKSFICPNLGTRMTLAPNAIVIKTPNNVFSHYLLKTAEMQNEIQVISSATSLPKFNKTSFKKLSVITPPDTLQQEFASKIDSIERQKDKVNQSVVETKKLFDYTMNKYFG